MSDDSEPRLEVEHDARATKAVMLANKDILRRMSLGECCFCDCKDCTDVYRLRQEAMQTEAEAAGGGVCASVEACDSLLTPHTRCQANRYGNAHFNKYVHCTHTSKHMTKQEKPHMSISQKLKRIINKMRKTYLQKIKSFVYNCKKSTAKITYKTNRRNNVKPASLNENQVKRMNKNSFCETASRVRRLSIINGPTHVLKKNIVSNSFSPTNTSIRADRMKHQKAKECQKLIATNLLSKLMFHLKAMLNIKSQTTHKFKRKKHTPYEQQTFIVNCILPYQHHSFVSVEEIIEAESNKQFREVDAVSAMISASISSQSFNDQGNQVPSQTGVLSRIGDFEDFVKKLSTCNVHSECILRSNDVLLQYRNKKSKTNIKKSRRVTFRGHHRRFMYKTYRQNFNKTYHTFLAEIDYTNPACPQFNRQGVGIGSTWDFCIDFGRSTTQDVPGQRGIDAGLSQTDGVKTGANGSDLLPFQCPPGTCVSSECDPNKCFRLLKNPAPYGSHAATQSRKYKLRDQRTRESLYGRKRVKTKRRKGKKGRENKLAGNHFEPPINARVGLPPRQTVRIGSKCSFNVQLYKETPMGLRTAQPLKRRQSSVQYDQGDTTVQRKGRKTGDKRRPLKTFECEPGVCVRGKCNPSECFKQFEGETCKPKVCVPGKCDPSDCYKRQRASHTGTDTSFAGSSIGSSQVATQSRKLNERHLRAGRETFYKEKGVLSKPRAKAQLNIPNRQAVRIGSKCSFNIEFYKSWPQNGPSGPGIGDQGDISDRRKPGDTKNGKGLKKYQCEPGVCIPGKCNANECFQELKTKQSTGTDASFTGSSKITSQGSQASAKKRKKQDLRAGKSTFYKDKGVSSMPRSKMPLQIGNRQAVRIGSKCSFNIEFYKSWPQNGSQNAMSEQTGIQRQGKALRKYQCEPTTCVPGKCNANECFQVLKTKYQSSGLGSSVTGSSKGSQASTKRLKPKGGMLTAGKATFYKDTGVSSMPMSRRPLHIPNRQAVRIGSKCSFNIEIYKSSPNGLQNSIQNGMQNNIPNGMQNGMQNGIQNGMQNGFMMNEPNYRSGKITPRNLFECEPGVCIPGKCIPSDCFKQYECTPKICIPGKCDPKDCIQRLRTPTGTDTSFTGSSVSTQSRKLKDQQSRGGNKQTATLYKEKGVSNVQRYKHTMRTSKRQAVRIGSSCSFNIEFYKDVAPPMYEQNYPPEMNFSNQGDIPTQYTAGTRKKRKKYECVPGVCIPGKCNAAKCFHQLKNMSEYGQSDTSGGRKAGAKKKRKALNPYACPAGVCIPGKCNAMECYQRLKGSSGSEDDQSDTSGRRKVRTKKKDRALKQDVCAPGVCIPGKCNAAECFHRLRGLSGVKNYECERGVCISGKCNPKECFQIFKAKHSTDDSLTDSSIAASRASQATTKKRKSKGPELNAKNATFYKERGASSMPRSKTPLYIRNRQAVRIGSTCSFNIEFYKEQPKKGATSQQMQRRPRPFQYGADQDRHYPAYYYPSSTETGGDQSSSTVCECTRQLMGIEKKDTPMDKTGTPSKQKKARAGKKKAPTEKKDLLAEEKGPLISRKEKHGKKEPHEKKRKTTEIKVDKKEKSKTKQKKQSGHPKQGDATALQKTSSPTEVTKKGTKRKPTHVQPSLQQSKLDDAGTKPKSSTERKDKALKGKTTRQKHSQTRVRDQQSDTAVDAKVGTRNLQDQGDVTTQRSAAIRQKSMSSKEKSKREYDQGDKGFEGEHGVKTLDTRNEGTSTDASLSKLSPRSNDLVSVSRAAGVNLDRKEEAERRKTQTKTAPVHREVGTASITTSKSYDEFQQHVLPMPPPRPPGQKKQAVRIGSSCSFNIQFFREKPLTGAQIASLRAAAVPPKRELPVVQAPPPKQGFMAFIKNCCKLGGTNGQCLDSCTGVQHGSQTTQRFECMPGYCDLSICQRNQCPAKMNLIDTGTGTHFRGLGRPTVQSYSANAATQSRRFPGIQQMAMNDSSFAALCKCMGKIGPSRGSTGLRNGPYGIQGSPFGPITGFGDDANRYQVREQAVIIGSGCGFNVNFFKKRK